MKSLSSGVYAIVFDGEIDKALVQTAEKVNVKFIVAMDTKVKNSETKANILTVNEL